MLSDNYIVPEITWLFLRNYRDLIRCMGRSHGLIPTCHWRTNTIRMDPEAYRRLLMRHSVFYNTEPQIGQLVNGIVASLEEQIGMGKDIDENEPVTVKASLIGPLARIGDSIMQGIIVVEVCLLPLSPYCSVCAETKLIQDIFNSFSPGLRSLVRVLIAWWLIAIKRVTATKAR